MEPNISSLVFLQYLSTVFDNIRDAIMMIDIEPEQHFRLLLANQAYFETTGRTREELGKLVSDIVSPEIYSKLLPNYSQAIRTRAPVDFATWLDVPLGHRAYEIKVIPIFNAVGECVQLAIIIRNVTELYKLRSQIATLCKQQAGFD